MSDADWIRIYLDREKLSALSRFIKPTKARRAMEFARKFDIELIFAKLPLSSIIPDTSLDELIERIFEEKRTYTVREFVDNLLSGNKIESGELCVVEAFEEPKEAAAVIRQDGKKFPILEGGAYFAYRPPFQRLTLFDGTYHSAFILDAEKVHIGNQDWVKILIKEQPTIDVANMLDNWDCFHARVTGILGPCPPYLCRTRRTGSDYEVLRANSAIYAICVDVTSPKNTELMERIRTSWRHH